MSLLKDEGILEEETWMKTIDGLHGIECISCMIDTSLGLRPGWSGDTNTIILHRILLFINSYA